MPESHDTIAERIRLQGMRLTSAEHRLVDALFANYPVAGLSSITEFAASAGVSTPTVLRLAKKLGFSGFPAFQAELRAELSAQLQNPIARRDRWASEAPEEHILNRFSQAVLDNLRTSMKRLDHREFDRISELLAQRRQTIHTLGGRITYPLAQYLHTHLEMVRPGAFLMPAQPALWPQYLLNLDRNSLLVVFDIRRYDPQILEIAKLADARGAKTILVTDQWMSPIASFALHSIPLRIEVPSSWDSNIAPLFLIEALIAAIANHHWPETQRRIKELEALTEAQRKGRK
ncbi:MAG: MurR/RpiR family transcriptional regulator [Rhizobiales bacterium]|nr:MurR/RpiR family transcriptional regulator [Hyphomicrobiales bacterium]